MSSSFGVFHVPECLSIIRKNGFFCILYIPEKHYPDIFGELR